MLSIPMYHCLEKSFLNWRSRRIYQILSIYWFPTHCKAIHLHKFRLVNSWDPNKYSQIILPIKSLHMSHYWDNWARLLSVSFCNRDVILLKHNRMSASKFQPFPLFNTQCTHGTKSSLIMPGCMWDPFLNQKFWHCRIHFVHGNPKVE